MARLTQDYHSRACFSACFETHINTVYRKHFSLSKCGDYMKIQLRSVDIMATCMSTFAFLLCVAGMVHLSSETLERLMTLLVVLGCLVGVLSFASGCGGVSHRCHPHGSKGATESDVIRRLSKDASGPGPDRTIKAQPTAIATWSFGEIAVEAAKECLADRGRAVDALEAGTVLTPSLGNRCWDRDMWCFSHVQGRDRERRVALREAIRRGHEGVAHFSYKSGGDSCCSLGQDIFELNCHCGRWVVDQSRVCRQGNTCGPRERQLSSLVMGHLQRYRIAKFSQSIFHCTTNQTCSVKQQTAHR